jgi:hypothetical protein
MRLRATPFKWLLIGLMLVSFAGRPWAQSLPASVSGCGGLGTAAAATMDHADSAAAQETGKIAAGETTSPQHDSGKTKGADCVKSCAAAPILALTATPSWASGIWPQIHGTPVEVALNGQTPKPELSPPIARA